MFDPYFSKFSFIIVDLVKYTNPSFVLKTEMFKNNTPKSPIRALMIKKPNAKFDYVKVCTETEQHVKVILKIDELEFSSKSSSKNKAKIKVCKKAIKKLHPDENILFF